MKCQYCEKPATFHITELTGDAGPQVLHLCEDHARDFLQSGKSDTPQLSAAAGSIVQSLNLGGTKAELEEMDQQVCPTCGLTFYEFRSSGRLGCPNDYEMFESDLQPLLTNIHESTRHVGKRPRRAAALADSREDLIALRRQMDEAVEAEDYERAGEIRDSLRSLESRLSDADDHETDA